MIFENIKINNILNKVEKLLHITPTCDSLMDQITTSRSLLQQEFQTAIPVQGVPDIIEYDTVRTFVSRLTGYVSDMALLVNIEAYECQCGQTLKDINYLGGQENKLVNSFKILTKKDLVHRKVEFMDDLLKSFSVLQPGELRRIVCIIGVLSNLNLPEVAAIFANHIVLGAYM